MPSSTTSGSSDAHRSLLSHSLSISQQGLPFLRNRRQTQQEPQTQLIAAAEIDYQTQSMMSGRSEESVPLKAAPSSISLRSGTPHDRVLNALIMRLKGSLPVHAKRNLSLVEADDALSQTVASIVQLAKFKLDSVVWALAGLLDELSTKSPPMPSTSAYVEQRYPPLDVLQSQLYVLKILSAAMIFRWQQYAAEQPNRAKRKSMDPDRSRQASSSTTASTDESSAAGPSTKAPSVATRSFSDQARTRQLSSSTSGSASLSSPPAAGTGSVSAPPTALMSNFPHPWSPSVVSSPISTVQDSSTITNSIYPHWSDPPQIGDQVAKYMLSTLLPYLRRSSRQTSVLSGMDGTLDQDRNTNGGHLFAPSIPDLRPHGSPLVRTPNQAHVFSMSSPSTPSLSASSYQSPSNNSPAGVFLYPPGQTHSIRSHTAHQPLSHPSAVPLSESVNDILMPTPPALSSTPTGCLSAIHSFISRIVFHLSGSNWSVVYERIREKIKVKTSEEKEDMDMTEIELVSLSALNRTRLIQVLNDLTNLLMPRATRDAVAVALHAAVMKWIETYPSEFISVIRGEYKLDGAPERVFDTLNNLEGTPMCKHPTLVVLLAIAPDRLRNMTLGGPGKSRRNILDTLAKSLNSNSQQTDVAITCYINLCTAAIRIPPTDEASALRSLAPDLVDDLRGRLINPGLPLKPFWQAHDSIDVQLYANALVAMFWYYPTYTVETVLPLLLKPEQSHAVKLVAISMMTIVLAEKFQLEHQPPVELLYPLASSRLPDLFHVFANPPGAEDDSAVSVSYHPVMKQAETDELSEQDQLLLAMIALWRADFAFLLPADSYENQMALFTSMLVDTQVLLRSTPHRVVRIVVTQFNLEFVHYVRDVVAPRREHNVSEFTSTSGLTPYICFLAERLLVPHNSYDDERHLLSVLHTFLYNFRVSIRLAQGDGKYVSDDFALTLNLVEVALLMSLVSPQSDICLTASACLRLLAETDPANPKRADALSCLSREQCSARLTAYMELGDPAVKVIGRQAQQKRVRNILKRIAFPAPINVAVWEECSRRLASFTPSIIWPAADDHLTGVEQGSKWTSFDEEKFAWQSHLNFLAAFAGCCFNTRADACSIKRFVPAKYLPEQFLVTKQPDILLSTYMSATTEILVRGGAFARDTAREALGNELDPRLHPVLLGHIERLCLANLSDSSIRSTDQENDLVVFMTQVATVLKLVFLKTHDTRWPASAIDLGRILKLFKDFINTRDVNKEDVLRALLQYAALCETVFGRVDSPLAAGVTLKEELLEAFTDWVTELQPELHASHASSILKDVELACLRAIVVIARDLRLQCEDGPSMLQEQSRVFYRYFRFFIAIVHRTLIAQPLMNIGKADTSSDIKHILAEKEQSILRELALSGLTHLAIANHRASFKHCLKMTYNEDPRIRAAFLRIFTEALDRDVRFEVAEAVISAAKSDHLAEFVKDPNFMVIQAICEVSSTSEEIDDLEAVLLHIFDTEESLIGLSKNLIDQEFRHTAQTSELFRNNSLRNRLLSRIARDHSAAYLRRVLTPLIRLVVDLPPEKTLEVDPFKLSEDDDVTENAQYVMRLTEAFLTTIDAASARVPTIIREMSHHISATVYQQAGQAPVPSAVPAVPTVPTVQLAYSAVGGFIFLRCINPAISQPGTVGIEIEMSHRNQRVLLLVTKIIQSLANNIQFGKEAYMTIFNDFLQKESSVVTKFIRDISSDPRKKPINWSEKTAQDSDETDLLILHRFLTKHASALGQQLLTMHHQVSAPEDASVYQSEGQRLWDQLVKNLIGRGNGPEIHERISLSMDSHATYQEFMRRQHNVNIDPVAHLFCRLPSPSIMFLFNASKVEADIMDYNAFYSLVFEELRANADQDYQLMIDMTSFSELSEIPLRWIKYFIELTPLEFCLGLQAIYFVNINRTARRYLRKLYHVFAGIGLEHVQALACTVHDLEQSFPSCSALQPIIKINAESAVEFKDIDHWDRFQSREQSTLLVARTHLKVETVKAQQIFPGFQCQLTEIIPLTEVNDVVHLPGASDAFFFALVRNNDAGDIMKFSTKEGEAVMRAIRKARESRESSRLRPLDHSYRLNAATTLLNAALVNLCNPDEHVRLGALGLIRSLSPRIGYNEDLSPDGFFLPANPHGTAIHVVDSIVRSAPTILVDFLKDYCAGFSQLTTAETTTTLQYLKPCIKGLAVDVLSHSTYLARDSTSMRIRDCMRSLINLTVMHETVWGAIQGAVWIPVSQHDSLSRIAVEEVVKAALDGDIGSKKCEMLAETMAVLASPYARGKIIARLQKLLTRVTFRSDLPLVDNGSWNEISVLVRLALVVTTDKKTPLQVLVYIPELCQFVTLLAGSGSERLRSSLHGLVLNVLHAVSGYRSELKMDLSICRSLVDRLRSAEVQHDFGIVRGRFGGTVCTSGDSGTGQIAPDVLRRITNVLLDVLEAGAKTPGQANMWRARWLSLAVATALRSGSHLQTRSFYVLGSLAASHAAIGSVDDDLIHQILNALDVSLVRTELSGKHQCLASILDCICKLLPALPSDSKHVGSLFWLAVGLLQAGIQELYGPSIDLLRAALDVFQHRGRLEHSTLPGLLMQSRGLINYNWQELDEHTGLSFDEWNFSISLSFVICKALRHPSSQDAARSLLYTLLLLTRDSQVEHSSMSTVSPDTLGYFIALASVSSSPSACLHLLRTARVGEDWWPDNLVKNAKNDLSITPLLRFGMFGIGAENQIDALLVSTYIVYLLNTARADNEREILCHLLAGAAVDHPRAIELTFEQLEKTTDSFTTSNNRSILEAVGTIFSVALARSARSSTSVGGYTATDSASRATTPNDSLRHSLDELCMTGLMGGTPTSMLENCAIMIKMFP